MPRGRDPGRAAGDLRGVRTAAEPKASNSPTAPAPTGRGCGARISATPMNPCTPTATQRRGPISIAIGKGWGASFRSSGGEHLAGLAQPLDMGVHAGEAGPPVATWMWLAPSVRHSSTTLRQSSGVPAAAFRRGSMPNDGRIAAGLAQPAVDLLDRLGEAAGPGHRCAVAGSRRRSARPV